ncbi:MAG: hypothetical protein JWQ19_1832 [Subtercola sp.]|nr:hypothetical protein [Subtercola sp.]
MRITKSRLAATALAAAFIVGPAILVGATGASAQPMCTPGEDVPACVHHAPTPPTPPASLTETVYATPNTPNRFDVQIASHAPVTGYNEGDTTRYNAFVRCENGYSANGALVYTLDNRVPGEVGVAGDLVWSVEAPAGAAAGACTITTYDVASLRLHHAAQTLVIDPTSGTSDWWVTFTG